MTPWLAFIVWPALAMGMAWGAAAFVSDWRDDRRNRNQRKGNP